MPTPSQRVISLAAVIALGLAAPVSAQPLVPSEAPPLTEQRISLDLKGVDILDVLKLLSQKSGLNFVAGRNVSGRVTIFVSEVGVWEAFEQIIRANDLAYERQGTIITVMMSRDYELLYGEKFDERNRNVVLRLRYAKVIQVATVLNQIKSPVGRVVADEPTNTLILNDTPDRLKDMQEIIRQIDRPTQTRIYSLNYTEAEKLKEKIQELLSPVGIFTFDARTNKAVISDLEDVLKRIDQIIQAFDAPDGQVLIEAKILNVKLTDELSLGVDWQRVFSGIRTAVRSNFDSLSGSVITTGTSVTGGGLRILGSTNTDSQIVIEALRKMTNTDTLASPRIMVANNQEAKILVGTREPFVTVTTTVPSTGSTVNAPEVQFVDVGTKLYVTPNVKHDGYIQLKVRPEVSSAGTPVSTPGGGQVPVVSTTEAETNVLVKSGVTLIIGGLINSTATKSGNQVPGLGSLPLIGGAFRGKNDTINKSELVLFLTPQIVHPDGTDYVPPPPSPPASGPLSQVVLQDPVPLEYRVKVRRHLESHLTSQFIAANLPHGSVVISFVVSQDGQLVGEPRITSPQGEPFVKASGTALAESEPFPPFPSGSESTEVRFRIAIEYNP